jgi:uncharacterized cofD-like protein
MLLEIKPETRVVFISGGRGGTYILDALLAEATQHRLYTNCRVTSIPHPYDNGGHTGILRYKYDLPAMGDSSQLLAIHLRDEESRDYLVKRFEEENGVSRRTGNDLVTIAMKDGKRNLTEAIEHLSSRYKDFVGEIVPISNDNVDLVSTLEDGTEKKGESYIDDRENDEPAIVKIGFTPNNPKPNPRALEAIANSELIILPPATLWGSLLPTLITPGVQEALSITRAPIAWYPNVVTTSETHGYKLTDFAGRIVEALGRPIDFAFVNVPRHNLPLNYKKEGADYVADNLIVNGLVKSIYRDYLIEMEYNNERYVARHDGPGSIALLKRALQEAA